jgi:SAM-dependent methyltransferase
LVLALLGAGVHAYGVDPHRELLGHATRRAADVRPEEVLAHLQTLPAATLGGLVLSGVSDTAPAGVQLAVADEATRTLRPGGRLAVIVSDPASWPPVWRDLAPGRPFHPDTWGHLLHSRGLTGVRVEHRGPSSVVLAALPG